MTDPEHEGYRFMDEWPHEVIVLREGVDGAYSEFCRYPMHCGSIGRSAADKVFPHLAERSRNGCVPDGHYRIKSGSFERPVKAPFDFEEYFWALEHEEDDD